MKIFETKSAPNARRVRIFLAEKGIDMEYVQVDIEKGENLTKEFRQKNITTKIPVLELDDGSYIGESVAICRYFEELYPEIPLMGTSPQDKAVVEMWHRRVEWYLLAPVGMCFQHSTGYFKDRMTPVPEWGEECGKSVWKGLGLLENRLAESAYLAGNSYSIADIAAFCSIDFAKVIKIRATDEHINLKRWYETMRERPTSKA